ncbi:MAG: type II toxin-antitoxin system VapC family toxin [Actinomycetia bacterium]|nr:type II toxin-antitoxin system VapC family toxin [Actinomycetes bacterium]
MIYLIDTNILSEQRKLRPDNGVVAWLERTDAADLRLSVVTIGEIRRGITRLQLRRDLVQADRYERWLDRTLREFQDRIVPVDEPAAQRWGDLDARRPTPVADGVIGATAAAHGWTLVTRNTKDFQHIGVPLINPFTDEEVP